MKNKKAQSQIITTVLIILLVLASIVIVWQAYKGLVQRGTEEVESKAGCIGLDLNIAEVTCSAGTVSVTVTRGGDNVDGTDLIISATNADGDSVPVSGESINPLESNVINIPMGETGYGSETVVTIGLSLKDGAGLCAGASEEFSCSS